MILTNTVGVCYNESKLWDNDCREESTMNESIKAVHLVHTDGTGSDVTPA